MGKLAWEPVVTGLLNSRTNKARKTGLTMVIDNGLGLAATADVLAMSGHLIDLWKFGVGTSAFVQRETLEKKIALLKQHDVTAFPGGTLLEVALLEHHSRVYLRHAKELGFSAVEISDGTIPVPRFRRKRIIKGALDAGLIAITEVGKKDPKHQPTLDCIAEEALADLEWGATWVIIEGRESGKGVGVYDENGKVEEAAVARLTELMGPRVVDLIWEAPLKLQQTFLIERFGPNVSLGNIHADQVLALEALRSGLRFETLHTISDDLVRSGRWDPNEIERG
ncbi:MAG: phosphosulfolactate synthase [Pseudomonadales bacterium]